MTDNPTRSEHVIMMERIAVALERVAAAMEQQLPDPKDKLLDEKLGYEFDTRTRRSFDGNGLWEPITTYRQLVDHTAIALCNRGGFGKGSLEKVRNVLAGKGLKLRGDQ